MKPLPSILTGLLIASLIYNFFQYKSNKTDKQELTHQRDSIQNHAKELEVQQEILNDKLFEQSETIAIQADIIQNRELETIKEHESKLIILKKYEKLTRIYLVSNAQRDSIRAVLYPPGHHF